MTKGWAAAVAGFILCGLSPVAAQDRLVTTFVPEAQRHWDVGSLTGWRGVNVSDVAPSWDDWYDVGVFSATAGHYFTPHIKVDLDLSTTTKARVYRQDLISLPGTVPSFRSHEYRRTSATAALAYQFLENRWVHPFLGAGIEGLRETDRLEVQVLSPRGPLATPVFPETHIRYSARPFVTGGAKFYVSERAFIRTDILTAFSSDGVESAVWRVGVGVDF
jgi:outer membrane protein W